MKNSTKTIREKNPEEIYQTAIHFVKASKFLERERLRLDITPDQQEFFSYYFPAKVNIALGVELLFKCLLMIEKGEFQRTHKLDVLYKDLSSTSQNKLADLFRFLFDRDHTYKDANAFFEEKFGKGIGFSSDLKEVLKSVGDTFTEYRYPFDVKLSPANYGLEKISLALQAVIKELRPGINKDVNAEKKTTPQKKNNNPLGIEKCLDATNHAYAVVERNTNIAAAKPSPLGWGECNEAQRLRAVNMNIGGRRRPPTSARPGSVKRDFTVWKPALRFVSFKCVHWQASK